VLDRCAAAERALSPLAGKRILVVEDEAMIAAMIEDMLRQLGATVVGPAGTIAKGLVLAETEALDAALLDVNVRDERIDPIADILKGRGIPMLFATGYGARAMVDAPGASVIDKPFTEEKLASELTKILKVPA
jgi:CheY-like chemotaxis protein